MAKSSKSGLGRGLNSLLGGAYEEAVPAEPVPQRTLVEREKPASDDMRSTSSEPKRADSDVEKR